GDWYPSPHLYTGLTDGNYLAIGRATDICGNIEFDWIQGGENFEVDTQAPTGLAAAPAGGSYCPTTVSLTASDGTIYYTLDGSGPTTSSPVYVVPIDISIDTTLKFMAVDNCNNQSGTVTEVYYIDTTSPTVSIISPTDGSYLNSTTVVVSGTADDGTGSGIAAVLVNGWTASGTDSWSITFTDQYGEPVEVSSRDTLDFSYEVSVSGNYAYLAVRNSGLAIIDISDPLNPGTPVYRDTLGVSYGLYVTGGYAYLALSSGLAVIDVTDPLNPGFPVYRNTTSMCYGVYVDGNYAYLADTSSGLAVIDVSDPLNPGAPVYRDTFGSSWGIYVTGGYAFLADMPSGLAVIDVSDPLNPGAPVYRDTSGSSYEVYVTGGYAYVADSASGLAIIDITDPVNPGTPVYRDTTGLSHGIYVTGGYAYVADDVRGLAIIDVSDPLSPGFPAYLSTSGQSQEVYVTGGYAYVADWDPGLTVIDVSYLAPRIYSAIAVDNCSNISPPDSVSVMIDTGAPTVFIATPINGACINRPAVVVTGSVNDPEPSSGIAEVTVNGVSAEIFGGSWVVTLTGQGDGPLTLTATATDVAGNSADSAPVNIDVDTQPPTGLTATPAGGSYCPTAVSLNASDGTIYYTTDGTGPDTRSPIYIEPIYISADTTLKFMAADYCNNQAGTVTEIYTIYTTAPADPVASPAGGTYCVTTVSLSSTGAMTIYYTTDGTDPTTASPVYVAPIDVNVDMTLKAIAQEDQCGNLSGIMTEFYTVRCGGDGTFAPADNYTAGTRPYDVAVGDFNSDGIQDLAVANYNSNNVSVFQGNGNNGQGDGTFAPADNYNVMSAPRNVAVGDFNSDGIQDLAVTNYSSNTVSILQGSGSNGQGNGTFAPAENYNAGSGPFGLVVGDFNSDGIQDLAVTNYSNQRVSILLGNGRNGQGDGTFILDNNYLVGTGPIAISVGDFNSDGIQDLAVVNLSTNNVSILRGNGSNGQGNGTFSLIGNSNVGFGPRGISTGDFNSDGIQDLAVANFSDNNVSILRGNGSNGQGDGTFSLIGNYNVGTGPWGISTGDFNSDGIKDLAVTNYSSNNTSILLGNGSNGQGTGTFTLDNNYLVGTSPIAVSVGDFNSDGIQDLAVANYGSNNISILLGDGSNWQGDGTFGPLGNYTTGDRPISISKGDFNSDGINDLAVANYGANNVGIFLGNGSDGQGDGTFTFDNNYSAGSGPYGVLVGDFNSDGIQDLAVTNYGGGNVSILRGNGFNGQGDGTFSLTGNYGAGSNPRDISLGDFNSDGIQDLAVVSYGSGNVSILRGNGFNGQGNGTFTSAGSYPAGSGPMGISVGDFNSDAIQDLAVTNYSSNTVSILQGSGSNGQGDGTFTSSGSYSVVASPWDITVGDFNSDAIQDLAAANSDNNNVNILQGDGSNGQGDGSFTLTGPFSAGTGARDITVDDFNSDGIQDLAVTNNGGSNVSILLGNGSNGQGNGSFTLDNNYTVGSGPWGISVGDFNSDGIQDLAVVNYNSDSISILRGLGVY
ncbi:MAG: VCBS repeat-containing protein, partial [Deltaproteobacteria bacterium]